ncbi:hypothetical protein L210DRAFT_987092 [Boletus edulis BED1]|uniref:Uncharacterized protein n=1 Tax=Boletus edulis BED1 TaxID=1328754 RepID=A0AAD4BFX7_BOLED|nr:hypothetical protein L210DRAFT_987092 [Boletus edulis BED1]
MPSCKLSDTSAFKVKKMGPLQKKERARRILTGSYRPRVVRLLVGSGDAALQTDKSAFKAKKMGALLQKRKGEARPHRIIPQLRDAIQMETLDFDDKKADYPRELASEGEYDL